MKSTAPRPNGMSVSKSSSSSHSHCAPSSSSSPSCRPASVRPSSSSSSPCATSPASSSSSSRSASPSSCSPSSCAKSASLSRCFLSSHASVSCPSLLLSPSRRPPSSSRSLALIEEVDQDDSVTLCTTSRHSERKNKKQNLETGREKEEAALKTQDAEAVPSDAGGEAEGEKKNKKKGARKKKKSVAAVGGVVREKDASLFEDLDDLLNKCRSFIPELRKSNELLLEKEGQEIQIETTDNSMKKKKKESEAEQQQEEEAKKNKKKTKTELLEAEEREEDKPYIELELHLGLFDVKGSIPSDDELRAKNVSIVSSGVDLHAQDKALEASREDPVKFYLERRELQRRLDALYGQREGKEGRGEGEVDDLFSSSFVWRGGEREEEEESPGSRFKNKGMCGDHSSGRGLIEILSSGEESTDKEYD